MATFTPTTKRVQLVNNGSFTGNASGWTLGDGWSYGTNNAVFTYVGTDLITNGTFTGSASGWTLAGGWAYGSNNVTVNGLHDSIILQNVSAVTGSIYRLSYVITNNNTGSNGSMLTTGFTPNNQSITSNATYTIDLTATQTGSNQIRFNSLHSAIPLAATLDTVALNTLGTGALSQNVNTNSGQTYPVSITTSGTIGSITVSLGGASFNVPAGTTVSNNLLAASTILSIIASSDFNGAVTNVSIPGTAWTSTNRNTAVYTSVIKSTSANSFLLLENGFYLLLEDGSSKLILEQSTIGPIVWTAVTKN